MLTKTKVITHRFGGLLLLQSLVLITLSGCSQRHSTVAHHSVKEDVKFSLVQHDFVEIFNSKDSIVYEATQVGLAPIKLILLLDKDRSLLSIANKRSEIDFNYFYDSDIEGGLQKVRAYEDKKSVDVIFIFPAVTEEFPTYQVVKFDQADSSFSLGYLEIETHEPFSLDFTKLKYRNFECIFTAGKKSYSAKLSKGSNHEESN